MREQPWIRRIEEGAGLRKPRPSSHFGPSSPARQRPMEPVVPNIPAAWHGLAADDPDVLALFRRESLSSPRSARRRTPPAYLVQPFSLQWFLAAERLRYGGPGKWIPRVLEFGKHTGETLLGLGKNLGTDWARFAHHGAKVIVSNPHLDELQLVRRNFALRGLPVRCLHAPWSRLPLDDASVDVVNLSGLLSDCAEPRALVEEVYRVLKPGGKVVAIVPARPRRWQTWRNLRPLVAGLGSRELQRLFRPLFIEHRRLRRHMRRREVWWGYRWLPRPWLEHYFGRYWVLKAFKPVHVAAGVRRAAA